MSDLERRLSSALRAAASDVSQVHGLADGVRDRRRRHRRVVAASAVAATVVAAAVIPAAVLRLQSTDAGLTPGGMASDNPSRGAPPMSRAEPECDQLASPPPARPAPVHPIPDQQARYVALNDTGTVAAWFNVSGTLPELTVFDLAEGRRLAWEDLGVGEVSRPAMRIIGDAVYYRTATDPQVWMRYQWATESYPVYYRTCTPRPAG